MCTVLLLHRPGHAFPVLIAANRDERLDRAWDPPAAWWPDRPGVVGGRDRTAGGTWMAASCAGVVATVLNRPGSLGPAPGLRSRGELPLLALAAGTAAAGVAALGRLPAAEWRPFNMVVADAAGAWFLRGTGQGRPAVEPLGSGLHMVTAHDPNDLASPRTARHLPRFRAAPVPRPETGDWAAWEALLADAGQEGGAAAALRVPPIGGFGTVSSSLLAIGRDGGLDWRFAAGPAGAAPFLPVAMA
ncbi:NRDE family protein [Paeniroseomonas aquatica]|uniref:NRDE family protein n=1 Tax=Paeniroseomonas aquatica TaxID=373043 RepID=A0ABT8AB07_9PROT|nr:NRDE family protein [Paeniroseomonas aquatica]MDN3566993.1 NRDE family protein [Paeniroseomonas aquatica]